MAAPIELTSQNNGQSVKTDLGQFLVLYLAENPTTGYRWQIINSGLLTVASNEYSAGAKDDPQAGAGGTRRIEFIANQKGTSDLDIQCRREWEAVGQEIGRFHMTVEVR
jgi:inhibitor of cysteine peptidase